MIIGPSLEQAVIHDLDMPSCPGLHVESEDDVESIGGFAIVQRVCGKLKSGICNKIITIFTRHRDRRSCNYGSVRILFACETHFLYLRRGRELEVVAKHPKRLIKTALVS